MRYSTWMILLPIIACIYVLASGVHAIDDTEGKSADQLFDESNGVFSQVGDTRFPATPQAARQLEQSLSETSSAPLTQHLSSGESASPKDSRDLNAAESADTAAASNASTEVPAAEPTSTSESAPATASGQEIAGKWSLKLSDAQADLTLYQNQGAVIGIGTAQEGNATRHVTASGSLSGDKLSLDLVFFESVELYKLSLTQNVDSLSGGYVAYPSSGSTWTGNAEGIRSDSGA